MNLFGRLFVALLLMSAPAAGQDSRPIPGAGAWQMVNRLPIVQGPVCTARTDGPEADTMLLLNNDRVPILIAGRADWHDLSGDSDVSLSIDGGTPARLKADMLNNLVIISIDDPQLLKRLRAARRLDWTLPFGHYRADVAGLGAALDALSVCERAKAAAQAPPAPHTS